MSIADRISTSIHNLPTLPTIFTQLSEALEDPMVSNEKISRIISTDQSSAFKILKVANSPFFGAQGRIDSISQALMFLGHNEVRNIIFALTVMKLFSNKNQVEGIRPIDLWAHSIGVGICARNLGLATNQKNVENYFLAGILHDIGKVIFLEYVPKEYSKAVELAKNENISIGVAESKILGIDHLNAGRLLAEKWKMPSQIQEIISHHHTAQATRGMNHLLATVNLANILSRIFEFGFAGDKLIPEPNINIWDILGLSRGSIISLKDKILIDYSNTIKILLIN